MAHIRMAAFGRFTSDRGESWDWDGPKDGNLHEEGFPPDVMEAIKSGATITDHVAGERYSLTDDGKEIRIRPI